VLKYKTRNLRSIKCVKKLLHTRGDAKTVKKDWMKRGDRRQHEMKNL